MEPLYWINLRARPDRAAHMEAQLAGAGAAAGARRVEALTPADLPPVRGDGGRSPPELACLASHLEALRRIATEVSSEWALVAEDDAVFDRPFDLARLAASAPPGADMLQLTNMNADTLEPARAPELATLWRQWLPWHSSTILYAVRVAAIAPRLASLGLADLAAPVAACALLDLGAHPGLVPVADDYLYRLFRTAGSRVPMCLGDADLGSGIHEDHLPQHARWWRAIAAYRGRPEVARLLDGLAPAPTGVRTPTRPHPRGCPL